MIHLLHKIKLSVYIRMLSLEYFLCVLETFKACSLYWVLKDRYAAAAKEDEKGVRRRAWSC